MYMYIYMYTYTVLSAMSGSWFLMRKAFFRNRRFLLWDIAAASPYIGGFGPCRDDDADDEAAIWASRDEEHRARRERLCCAMRSPENAGQMKLMYEYNNIRTSKHVCIFQNTGVAYHTHTIKQQHILIHKWSGKKFRLTISTKH